MGDVVVVAMVPSGRLRLRLGCKRRARRAMGVSNFRMGKCFWGKCCKCSGECFWSWGVKDEM